MGRTCARTCSSPAHLRGKKERKSSTMFKASNMLWGGLQMHSKKLPVNKQNLKAKQARVQAVLDLLRKYNVNPGKDNKLPKPRDWTMDELPTATWAQKDKQLYVEKVSNKDGKFARWRTYKRSGKK
eukprot:Phypoly_transcript_24100.p1 GENE.Phypoly_transcript_24100~~Phypoly_transcript_24100.p1  ORF type:complete len:126 (+),score=16.56 Phypoly_transcript_24100:168-545(+)